jgi:hypothetical protein
LEQEGLIYYDGSNGIQNIDSLQIPNEFDWLQESNSSQFGELHSANFSSFSITPADIYTGPIWDSVSISHSGSTPDVSTNQLSNTVLYESDSLNGPEPVDVHQTASQPGSSSNTRARDCEAQQSQSADLAIWSLDLFSPHQVPSVRLEEYFHTPESHNNSEMNRNANSVGSSLAFENQTQDDQPLPCPTTTNVWIPQPVLLTAGLHNALTLNIALSSILTYRPLSPFYRPSTLPSDDPNMLISQATKQSFPPHLKPTLAQILFPHPAWLDLLPFPVLRERAITLAMTSPKIFDLFDLKLDILHEGFRYCSRGGDGRTEISGEPWDGRNWEVAPWFLRKWRMLMVGVEGTFWK